jgi:hypothetical protein
MSGNPNGRPKASLEIRDLARGYGPAGILKLAELAGLTDAPGAESETARIAALNALLDRGYGKATQLLESDEEMPHIIEFRWAKAGETDNAPVVDHEPVATAPPLEAVPANANVDTDEVPRYMLRFAASG